MKRCHDEREDVDRLSRHHNSADGHVRWRELIVESTPEPPSVGHMAFVRERGDGARTRVNQFLDHPVVGHELGGIQGWKAAWSARYKDYTIAVIVLGRPARNVSDSSEISVTRMAAHPHRPANTGSWMLAKARTWARLEGYDRIAAHAGIGGNAGTVYKAAGFEQVKAEWANGGGYANRPGRAVRPDYLRRKWIDEL